MSEQKCSSIGTMIVVAIAAGLIGYVIGKPPPPQIQAKASETPEKPREAEKPAESGEPANLARSAGQNKPTKPVKQSGQGAILGAVIGHNNGGRTAEGAAIGALAEARTVMVYFFKNETLVPRLVVAVNRALKRNLQQDGTFELKPSGNADFLVTGELTDFLCNGVSYTPGDTLTVQDYNLRLTAKIKVTVRVTGKVILDREITGSSIVRVGNDLTAGQAVRQAVPLIADQLARQATDLIVDVENKKANDQQSGLTKITNEPEENAASEEEGPEKSKPKK